MHVFVVDDHVLFRRCLVDFLTAQEDITEVREAAFPQPALAAVREHTPDIALVDIDLGGQDGLSLASDILDLCPECLVVMLTASQSEEQMRRALRIGAVGYVVKDTEPDSLMVVLRQVMKGEIAFPRAFLIDHLRNTVYSRGAPDTAAPFEHTLTERELQVLQLVTNGMRDKQVAAQLSVSENTVKNHMKSIRAKLGASNRVQATLMGIQLGVVRHPDWSMGQRNGPTDSA